MTPQGLNMVGTSPEDTWCISRIYPGPDTASPATCPLVAHPASLTPNNFLILKKSSFHICCPPHPGEGLSRAPPAHPAYCPRPLPPQPAGTHLPPPPPSPWRWQLLGREKKGWWEKGGGKNVEAGGCNHPSCCLFPQTNSRAIGVGEFNQRLSFPGTISPNENLIFFYRTLLH